MIVVTGGMGFIGSRLVHRLNEAGYEQILVVDDLTCGHKFQNLSNARIADYLDKNQFLDYIEKQHTGLPEIDVLFHQGACSTTTQWDGRLMMAENYEYSKRLFHYALKKQFPFIYASSAATYGKRTAHFTEDCQNEVPLNVYGYSKLLFDQYVQRYLPETHSQVVGLRYFNVYGPGEAHKQNMASVAYHLYHQYQRGEDLKLFAGSHGYADGEHCRDFIYVKDVCDVNLWFWQNPDQNGIFNCGTGIARSFLSMAKAIVNYFQAGNITFIPMPESLRANYQSFTQADLTRLRACGYPHTFTPLEQGIAEYMHWLDNDNKR